MTRESEKSKIRMSIVVDRKHINSLKKADEVIDQIFDEHEAQLKAKDEEIKELGEIVQQYLIPSKNYDAIIKAKNEEIVKLKLELFRSSPKIANKKSRSIVAMLFWEWKRAQKWVGKNHFAVKGNEDAFKKAYVMLKEK